MTQKSFIDRFLLETFLAAAITIVLFFSTTAANGSYVSRKSTAHSDSLRDLIYRWRWNDAQKLLDDENIIFDKLDDDFLRGYINLQLKNYSAAESIFSQIVGEKYDLGDWVIVFLAQSSYRAKHYDAAYNFSRLAGIIPAFKDTIAMIRWRSLWNADKKEAGIAQLDTLYQKKLIGKWSYKLQKAKLLVDIGNEREARKIFREILNKLYAKKDYRWIVKDAAQKFSTLDSLTDNDFKLLALSFYYTRSYTNAIKWFGRYSRTESEPLLRYFLATSYAKTGIYKTALVRLHNLLSNNEYNRSTLWWRIGYCYRKTKKFDRAEEALDSAFTECKKCENITSILLEKLFLAQDIDDIHKFALAGAMLAATDRGGNLGSAGLIWALTGYLAAGFPDSAIYYAEKLTRGFKSPDFIDEIRYWVAQNMISEGDTAIADSILNYLSFCERQNLFAWLAAQQKVPFEAPSPAKFKNISDYDADTIYFQAKQLLKHIMGKNFKNYILPDNELRFKAEHLAKMGLIWLAKPCFLELEKNGIFKKSTVLSDIELWRYYYSLGLYELSKNCGERIIAKLSERDKNNPKILRLDFILPFKKTVLQRCKMENIDPLFLYAVMYRESRYNPHAVSYANAMGLMQFIEKTGKSVASWLTIENFDNKYLFDYRTSISLGARLLSYLLNQRMSPYFALAEYNGGDKRTDSWVKNCPDKSNDIFCAEFIDSKQTRLYVKKTMGYYYTYHWLYGGLKNGETK